MYQTKYMYGLIIVFQLLLTRFKLDYLSEHAVKFHFVISLNLCIDCAITGETLGEKIQ